ncbi:MAG TPA: AIR synthase-related protein [Nitrososphaerales archaeon]|nr:AIR synthase-related protein [Nitrososphaerales archaeon]
MKPLSSGKIPIDILCSDVLRLTGAPSDKVSTPPRAGLDFAAVKVDGRYMIISADPVTGVAKNIGRYAVNASANDVATSGNRPQFAESVVLLPEGANANDVKKLALEIHTEAKRLGINIVGGHTEVTQGLHRPIVAITAFSFVDDYVSSQDAKENDTIMLTKTAGLEGTAILGRGKYLEEISVVDEAVAAHRTGHVHAMHDCTEGGVLGAVFEMSLASGLGFELHEKLVPVAPETRALCRRFSIDPLRLIGSGALLLSVEQGKEADLRRILAPICKVTAVGRFTKKEERILVGKSGRKHIVRSAPEDELWRVLADSSRRGKRP